MRRRQFIQSLLLIASSNELLAATPQCLQECGHEYVAGVVLRLAKQLADAEERVEIARLRHLEASDILLAVRVKGGNFSSERDAFEESAKDLRIADERRMQIEKQLQRMERMT